jgi:hypothetical protein
VASDRVWEEMTGDVLDKAATFALIYHPTGNTSREEERDENCPGASGSLHFIWI